MVALLVARYSLHLVTCTRRLLTFSTLARCLFLLSVACCLVVRHVVCVVCVFMCFVMLQEFLMQVTKLNQIGGGLPAQHKGLQISRTELGHGWQQM